jgi:DNA (cytosine-5)-methyltransferase 1
VSGQPRLLDLFCGAGGCSVGYHRAGFDVIGVDNRPQPNYPFEFHQADALTFPLEGFDAIHASPPCKSETRLRHVHDIDHPDLLTPTVERFAGLGVPWVIENVESTKKLPGALVLCGASFGLRAECDDGTLRLLRRHRRFASNVFMMAPPCACTSRIVGVYGHGGGPKRLLNRGYQATKAEAVAAMGIDWMSRDELSQAIPPAYTEYLGAQLLDHLKATR